MAGRKNTNKEKIEKAKKELETLSAILGEILDDATGFSFLKPINTFSD